MRLSDKPDKSKRYFHLHHTLTFGKYKDSGKTVEDLIIDDPEYMRWVVDNIEWMSLDRDAQDLLDGQPENSKNNSSNQRYKRIDNDW